MADTDDTRQPVDMNALIRNRDRAGLDAARRARLFGLADPQPDDSTADDTTEPDGGDTAA
jgi:hypothetical protein